MGRKLDEQLIESINHRLALLEQVAHRLTMLDDFNDRFTRVLDRLEHVEVDHDNVAQIASNLTEIAGAVAARFEAAEQRLHATEVRLNRLIELTQVGPAVSEPATG